MGIYIDSADIKAIEFLHTSGTISGVTTNPTILRRAGLHREDIPNLFSNLQSIGVQKVFLQTSGVSADHIFTSGMELFDLGTEVIVKVPHTIEGLQATQKLQEQGVPILLTAIYHPAQAVTARELGVWGLAPYVGRMTDLGRDGVKDTVSMGYFLSHSCHVLAASIRDADVAAQLLLNGVSDITASPTVLEEFIDNEHSKAALIEFESALL